MSFTINAQGLTKDDVMSQVRKEFDRILEFDKVHKIDREAMEAVADATLGMIQPLGPGQGLAISLSGSINYMGDPENPDSVMGVSFNGYVFKVAVPQPSPTEQ